MLRYFRSGFLKLAATRQQVNQTMWRHLGDQSEDKQERFS